MVMLDVERLRQREEAPAAGGAVVSARRRLCTDGARDKAFVVCRPVLFEAHSLALE